MKLSNPFLVYGYESPLYFCDRETETKKLVSALRNGRNVTLMSPRRIGKTGLIRNAFYHIKEQNPQTPCFYLDIYATRSLKDFVKVFGETVLGQLDSYSQKAMDLVRSALTHCRITYSSEKLIGGSVSLEFRKEEAEATLRDIFLYLKKTDEDCYVAIDEFQQIADYEESNMEALLRTYVQQCNNIHFVFSGSKNHLLSDMFDSPKRPFYRSTEKMNLRSINEDAYFEFAEKHLKPVMTILPREAFHQIYSSFHGHTWYIQYILNKIYEEAPAIVDEDIIKECLIDIVQCNTDDYQRMYRMLTFNQQQLLLAIAQEKNVEFINASYFIAKYELKGTSSVNKALKYLIDNEYVYHYEEGYQIYDRFMALWLRR